MDKRGAWSFLGPAFGGSAFLALAIVHAEGVSGFKPLLNLEALFLVVGGTGLCLGAAFPVAQVWRAVAGSVTGRPAVDDEEARRWGEVLRHGADSAAGMGGLATLLGMILLLSSVEDLAAVPRRMALALTALFYGLALSEAFFIPLSRRVRGPDLTLRLPPPGGGRRRMAVAAGAAGSAVLGLFVVLYAVSAALAKDVRLPEVFAPSARTRVVRFPFIALECEEKTTGRPAAQAPVGGPPWVRPAEFKSPAFSRSFLAGEALLLEVEEGRGALCQVLRPARP